MPVSGIFSKNTKDLKFSWRSPRTIYSIISFIIYMVMTIIITYSTFQMEIGFSTLTEIVFYACNTYIVYLFGVLARKWPKLINEWETVEKTLPQFRSEQEKLVVKHKIIKITIFTMIVATLEHISSVCTYIHSANCSKEDDKVRIFFLYSMNQMFHVLDYSLTTAIFIKIINLSCTFIWTYMDIFVILISLGISSKFKQLNDFLFRTKGTNQSERYWIEQRTNYQNICTLCENVDDAMGVITLISFSNNLYFICIQLLNSLKYYYFFSKF